MSSSYTRPPKKNNNPLPDDKLSRMLSSTLRHKAVELNLDVRPDGYVSIQQLLALPMYRNVSADAIVKVVKANGKQRFALTNIEDKTYIRANQGHSGAVANAISSDELLIELTEPIQGCLHGTYERAWQVIQTEGLKPMGRKHVHFAKGLLGEENVISGMRKSCTVIIYIDMTKAMQDGIKFFESANGVVLTESEIAPQYFSNVVHVGCGNKQK